MGGHGFHQGATASRLTRASFHIIKAAVDSQNGRNGFLIWRPRLCTINSALPFHGLGLRGRPVLLSRRKCDFVLRWKSVNDLMSSMRIIAFNSMF